MQPFELIILAAGLAMDAFAVSICKGLAMRTFTAAKAAVVALWFGAFQALMPIAGYIAGSRFLKQIEAADHWIAFAILALIGANMIREALKGEEAGGRSASNDIGFRTMLLLAVATSIDALAVGVTLAVLKTGILVPAGVIGIVTFGISFAGVWIGSIFGAKFRRGAQFAGGIILILIGVKILVEHLLG